MQYGNLISPTSIISNEYLAGGDSPNWGLVMGLLDSHLHTNLHG